MSKINFDEHNMKMLEKLKEAGFPDSSKVPMEMEEIKDLRIGTACYVISKSGVEPRLMMFLGFLRGNDKYEDEFRFCCYKGEYFYKVKNVGKTYNVFRTM